VVHAMWEDSRKNAMILSTDATSALIQPEQHIKGLHQACKKGHFFTVIADCDHVLFHYTEKHNQVAVQRLFSGFNALLQCDASNVYDILDRGPPVDTEEASMQGLVLVGCWAHYPESDVMWSRTDVGAIAPMYEGRAQFRTPDSAA
jgi:transposase